MPSSRVSLGLFVVVAAAGVFWGIVFSLISPQFAGTDVFIFKEAGVNWALGRGFVAASVPGNPSVEPAFYGSYPPLFPFLFGVFTKLFGLGAYQNTFFSLLTSFASFSLWVLLTFQASRREPGSRRWLWMCICLALMIPGGMLGTDPDRPETLSFSFLLLSLILSARHRSRDSALVLSFLLAGLNACVSPYAGLINLLAVTLVHARAFSESRWRLLAACALSFLLPVVAVLAFYAQADPQALLRLLAHGAGEHTGAGKVVRAVLRGDLMAYPRSLGAAAFRTGAQSLSLFCSSVAVLGLISLIAVIRHRTGGDTKALIQGLSLIALILFPFVLFPEQNNYMAFSRSAAAALMLCLFARYPRSAPGHSGALLAVMATLMLFQAPMTLRDLAIRSENRDSYARSLDRIRDFSKSGAYDPHGLAAIDPSLYFLLKPHFRVISAELVENPSDVARVSIVALGYAGSGDLYRPWIPPWFRTEAFELVFRPALPQRTEIFGFVVSKSSNTWEPELYTRRRVPDLSR